MLHTATTSNVEQSPLRLTAQSDEEDGMLLVVDSGGGNEDGHLMIATVRVGVVLVGALVIVVPWSLMLVVEEYSRRAMGSADTFSVRMFAWSYLTVMYDDVLRLSSLISPFGAMRWRFPEPLSRDREGNNLMALTIDDAPGDNPVELGALLDSLKSLNVQATFFCTTNYITEEMIPLMWRLVKEGHEVANHCPEDRIYSGESEELFQTHLHESESVLEPFFNHQDKVWQEQGHSKKWRWFRPPSGNMSTAMASVLQRHGYSNVLGDCFSNDVFVGGSLKDKPAGPNTVAYHTTYCLQRAKPGSIAIFHSPQSSERLMSREVVSDFVKTVSGKGIKCVKLSDLAIAVDTNSSSE